MDIKEIARELIDGLDNDIREVITGLERIMEEENLTFEELRERCWKDSNEMFQKIYN